MHVLSNILWINVVGGIDLLDDKNIQWSRVQSNRDMIQHCIPIITVRSSSLRRSCIVEISHELAALLVKTWEVLIAYISILKPSTCLKQSVGKLQIGICDIFFQTFLYYQIQVHLFMQEHEKRKAWRVIIPSKYQLTMIYTKCWLSLSQWDESILLSYHICIKSQELMNCMTNVKGT